MIHWWPLPSKCFISQASSGLWAGGSCWSYSSKHQNIIGFSVKFSTCSWCMSLDSSFVEANYSFILHAQYQGVDELALRYQHIWCWPYSSAIFRLQHERCKNNCCSLKYIMSYLPYWYNSKWPAYLIYPLSIMLVICCVLHIYFYMYHFMKHHPGTISGNRGYLHYWMPTWNIIESQKFWRRILNFEAEKFSICVLSFPC